ncbi:MAG: MOSC domain-containing protein [Parvibaculum sp.]
MSEAQFAIKEIWRYPVKSMQGEKLQGALLTPGGIPLDRGWAVRDEKTQTIAGAKKIKTLLNCEARYLMGTNAGSVPHVEITLPDGTTLRTDDTLVHEKLSDALGTAVTLWPLQPASDTDHYRTKEKPADAMAALRATFALEPGEPLPDFSKFPAELLAELTEFASPRGTYFDAFPLDMLTEASLRHLQTLAPDADLDIRRFRPNILLSDDQNMTSLAETGWVGQTVTLGSTKIHVDMECPRCIMTTLAQQDLPRDAAIMRAMVAQTKQNLSVYCTVKTGGQITVGDRLNLD